MSGSNIGGALLFKSADPSSGDVAYDNIPIDVMAAIAAHLQGPNAQAGVQMYFNHFLRWEGPVAEGAAGGWTLTDATGTSTIVLGDVRGGEIILTADSTSGADSCLQLGTTTTGKNFGFTTGKGMWCFARMKTSTVSTGWKFFMGFGTPTTTPGNSAPTNGIFLRNGTTVNKLDLVAKEGSNSTAKTDQITLVAATYYVIGFVVDRQGAVHLYKDGAEVTAAAIAAASTGLATLDGDATKTLQFMLDQKLASATLTLDWLMMGQEV